MIPFNSGSAASGLKHFCFNRESFEAYLSLRVSMVSSLRRGRQTRAVGALAPSPPLSDSDPQSPCTAAPFSLGEARPVLPGLSCCSGWHRLAPGPAAAILQHACEARGWDIRTHAEAMRYAVLHGPKDGHSAQSQSGHQGTWKDPSKWTAQWGTCSQHIKPGAALHDRIAASRAIWPWTCMQTAQAADGLPKLPTDWTAPAGLSPFASKTAGAAWPIQYAHMRLRLIGAACAQHQLLACTPTWALSLPDMQA